MLIFEQLQFSITLGLCPSSDPMYRGSPALKFKFFWLILVPSMCEHHLGCEGKNQNENYQITPPPYYHVNSLMESTQNKDAHNIQNLHATKTSRTQFTCVVRGVISIPSGQLQEGRDQRQMERRTEHMDAVSSKSKQPQPGQEQTKELPK